jgi:glutathione S-transferase
MNTTLTHPVSLKVSRLIKAPRPRVFAAWTNVNELAQWLGCGPRKILSATNDLRVGGEYKIETISEKYGEMNFAGQYREISPVSRIAFSWKGGNCNPDLKGIDTLVTVDLTEEKDGTLVQITHEGFPTTEIRDRHAEGWTASLEGLEKLV